MPVARSDPRRSTYIGIAGVLVGLVLVGAVLFAGKGGDDLSVTESRTEFDVGPAKDRAAAIARDRTPLLFQDTADFARPIWVQHSGDDADKGWLAFDAAVDRCATTWDRDAQHFTDCRGTVYPADGKGLFQYPVRVADGEVFVNLHPEVTTTTKVVTTTTVLVTN